jgi:hypothetical protein
MVGNHLIGKNSVLVKQRIQKSVGLAMIVAFAFATLNGSQSFAQQATTNNSTNVLKVSPVRSDVQIPAGSSKTVQITVSNVTSSPITVTGIENDFISGDENGTPSLILDANTYAPTHSLKRFMTPIKDVTIPGNQAKTIDVLITVPANTQAGGYFGAVRFAPASNGTGGQVNLSGSVASLILLTIPGPTTEKLNLTDFTVQQGTKAGNFFNTTDDLSVLVRFENKGNIQEGPFGKISVQNGKKVVYQTDFNVTDPRDQVLPDGARKWTVPLKDLGTFGHYTVTATLTYGQSNQSIEAVKTFWVIPQSYIIGAAVALVVLIGLIILAIFLIRGRQRRRQRNRLHGNSRYRR